MATVSFTIPDPIVGRVNDGVAKFWGYQAQIPDGSGGMIPNPESKGQFSKRMTREQWKSWVVAAEANDGSVTAREPAEAEIDIQD